MGNLGQLPTEMVLLIMQHLSRWDIHTCAHINKHWYIATMPLRWRSLRIGKRIDLKSFTAKTLESPCNAGGCIRHLTFTTPLTDTILLLLMKHLIHLESITLKACQDITDKSFQHLPRHCPNLRSLRVASCGITELSIIQLGHHCRQLKSLVLEDCHDIAMNVFSTLVYDDASPSFSSSSHHATTTTEDVSKNITTTTTTTPYLIQKSTASILALDMYVTDGLAPHHLDNAQRRAATRPPSTSVHGIIPWPFLTEIHLGGLFNVGDSGIIALIQTHPYLQHIDLTQTRFSNAVLDAITTSGCGACLLTLQVPGNRWITSAGLRDLVYRCPCLRWINVDGCGISDNAFPEASAECYVDVEERMRRSFGAAMWVGDESPSGITSSMGRAPFGLCCLDQEAVDKIRIRGHNRTNHHLDFSSFFPPM
ncbi:hypothetical protein BCR42DRAFT_456124 [Absidia repens]|uniref:F-box domain-containing protein n=1 Tax=Absidia repens TaxID=90262 RepID=A0A1X2I167_9FUNG|nr:hypothetical protein BCR42DRAFT_456124 [Absidia repens]